MLRTLFSGCLFVLASTPLLADTHLIAIDVLLIPDAKMMDVSSQWNAKMREKTPAGFELDAAHQPHVTLLQRHIKKEDLEEVLSAIAKLRDGYDLANLSMTANGLYHIPSGDQGLAGITIELSQQLRDLQNAVIETVNRYDAGKADETAYAEDPTGTPFDPYLFEYVTGFVPGQSGEKFNPHVTIGLAPIGWLEEVETLPFNGFEFGASEIAVYQLGNFGTAAVRLDQ